MADVFEVLLAGTAQEKELPKISGKSKLAEAICDAIARRTILERFL